MEPPEMLSAAAQAIWRQLAARNPEAQADPMALANYCAATARARRLASGDRGLRASRIVEQQRRLADALGLGDAGKEPARQRVAQSMVRIRGRGEGVPSGASYVANDGSEVPIQLAPGEEADVTEGFARMLERLGQAERV